MRCVGPWRRSCIEAEIAATNMSPPLPISFACTCLPPAATYALKELRQHQHQHEHQYQHEQDQ